MNQTATRIAADCTGGGWTLCILLPIALYLLMGLGIAVTTKRIECVLCWTCWPVEKVADRCHPETSPV